MKGISAIQKAGCTLWNVSSLPFAVYSLCLIIRSGFENALVFRLSTFTVYHTTYRNTCKNLLRHTHASLLAEAGIDLVQIMKRLGHSDDTTTRQIYLHVTKTLATETAEKFDNLLNKA